MTLAASRARMPVADGRPCNGQPLIARNFATLALADRFGRPGHRRAHMGGLRAMADTDKLDAVQAPKPRDVFEGIKGRAPNTDRELEEWLASDEGKAAMIFEGTSASRWGEIGRS